MCNLDGDNPPHVGLSDLAILLSSYGLCADDPGYIEEADINCSGCVGLADLATLLSCYEQ